MKRKIIWIIVAVVLILGAVGGGIYFYYFKGASADVNVNDLTQIIRVKTQDLLAEQRLKYPNGSCLPRYRFNAYGYYNISGSKVYIKILINRQKSVNCYIDGSECKVAFGASEYDDSYYQYIRGGLKPIKKLYGGLWNEAFRGGDDFNAAYKLPFACCQVGPTITPTPSSTSSPTPTRTTTPSPSSTRSMGPTPSGF